MILFGLRDTGAINVCLPVMKMLENRNLPISVYVEGQACEKLKKQPSVFSDCRIDDLFNSVRPSLVVVTCSTIGTGTIIPLGLTDEAKRRNIPVILVEDLWSGHNCVKWDVFPDGVCVIDNYAKDLILKSWPDYSAERIYVTGSPHFDRFADLCIRFYKDTLRTALNLREDRPIIFFAGEAWGMAQAITMLVEALNDLGIPVYLIVRDHPKITRFDTTEEFRHIYLEYREVLKHLRVGNVVDSSRLSSDEVSAGSDVVIGIRSTMLLEACYLRKPTLSIWTEEMGRMFFIVAGNTFGELPMTQLGAILKAESVEDIKRALLKFLQGDTTDILEAQERHFRADGLNAKRVADVVINYYQQK